MATLCQHLCSWNNDYTELEKEYFRITGAELVIDPYSSFEKGLQYITKSASVLIGTYNSKESLEKCLISIEQSTFNMKFPQLIEVIVVDDGSTDGTGEMIKSLNIDLGLKYILQDRGGLTKAHNTGLAFAENDIIIFSDSDMVHTQYAIEELMKRHEVLDNVTLAGFRFEIDPKDPRISTLSIREKLHELLPEFYQDFRLNFPGRPENICRDTRHWKDYGYNKKIMMANGAGYDLPAMVVGAFFSIRREDYIKMGRSDKRLVGWGCEDSLIGARSIALGNYIIPVYSAASAHISHPRRTSNEGNEFAENIRTVSIILDQEFVTRTDISGYRNEIKDYFVKTPLSSALLRKKTCRPYPLAVVTAEDHAKRGKYYYSLGLFSNALNHYEEALKLLPDSSWLYLEKGKALRESEDYENAILVFSRCLEHDARNAWAYFEGGLTYACMSDYKAARQFLEMARNIDPSIFNFRWALETSSEQHKRRGNHHANQGDHKLAIRDFELALTVDENNCWAHFDRGLSLRCLGRLNDALQSFLKTDELLHKEDGNRTWVHTELGKTYFDTGDYNKAKLQLETALQFSPENSQAHSYLEKLNSKLEQEISLVCHLPIIQKVGDIKGWLSEAEADLLIAATIRSASLDSISSDTSCIVEIGSYCGKSTIVLGRTIKTLNKQNLKLYAIDPHERYESGGNLDTYPLLKENISRNEIEEYVEIIKAKSTEVKWDKPIALLFIDGLHDYESVKNDFLHFKDFVVDGGLIAFHDYAWYFPEVKRFINKILLADKFQFVTQRDSLILIKKLKEEKLP